MPGASRLVRGAARYVFPDHWSFLFGEIALYCFLVLVATGVYLTFWFDPEPRDDHLPRQLRPARRLADVGRLSVDGRSLDSIRARGCSIRQTHHWAALVFIVAIVLHMLRVFFTGAFRKPRDLNWYLGLTMLIVALVEGFAGYSLPDDLLSGMGLAIAYSVVMSVPWLGAHLALWAWNGAFPGSGAIEQRLYILHVLILPLVIAGLLGLHLFLVALLKHTMFPGPGRTERTVVGTRLWPALRAALARPPVRRRRRAGRARRPRADQPGLAVGRVRDLARHERRTAGLVPRLADRRAAADARRSTS